MTDEEIDRMADNFVNAQEFTRVYSVARKSECGAFWKYGFLAGLEAGRPKWHKYSERPVKKLNALCFDIKQNKFILGFYDLEADEWLRYGGYETIHIDLWKEIVLPELN